MLWIGLLVLVILVGGTGILFYLRNLTRLALWAIRRSLGFSRHELAIGKHRLAYLQGGKGPTLVLLHGFGGSKENWSRLCAYLSADYHVVVPDLPGFGESSRLWEESYDVDNQVERLHTLFADLKLGAFHLAGNSMGGLIACAYAVRYPDEVLSLTLIDAAGVISAKASEMVELLRQGKNPLIVESPSDYDRLLSFLCSRPPALPGLIKAAMSKEAVRHRTFNEKVFKDLGWVKLEPVLPQVRCPVLVVWGDQDRVFDVSCAAVFEQGLNNARTAILHECGHMPMFERPEETAGYLREFLAQLK